ncbi:MAG: VWA domain-containing protein [Phycisphaerae bacterium]
MGRNARRGAVVVQVAISSMMMLGIGALTVDLSTLYTAKSELQKAADAAALAAASQMATNTHSGIQGLAFSSADAAARANKVMGLSQQLSSSDVQLGQSVYHASTGRSTFQAGGSTYNAVKVTVNRTQGSAGGRIPLTFARLMGVPDRDMTASAAAMLIPRDIAVVIDISNSMNWDSQLRFWDRTDGGYANTRDIWAALNGPSPSRPYSPADEQNSEYAGDNGPTIGFMSNWGDPLIPGGYDPSTDPGLWKIQRYTTTSNSTIRSKLVTSGCSNDEITQLFSSANDSNQTRFENRVAVMLGLATWKSGRPGGRAGGNGDTKVDSTELTWIAYPSYKVNWTWREYVQFVAGFSSSHLATDVPVFSNRYGLKTYIDFLLDQRPQYNETNNLWDTPQQPLRALKDAVQVMSNVVANGQSLDQMSLHVFAQTARNEVQLTSTVQNVPNTLYGRQSGHYDRATNIGAGLQLARAELKSSRARQGATKVIVLMSDGVPNCDASGTYYYDGAPQAVNYALQQAQLCANDNMRIYCVSVGAGVDRSVMQQIAAIAYGQEFYASGTPEEYTAQLDSIFRQLGGVHPVVLIE